MQRTLVQWLLYHEFPQRNMSFVSSSEAMQKSRSAAIANRNGFIYLFPLLNQSGFFTPFFNQPVRTLYFLIAW